MFAAIVLILTSVRLNYTLHLPKGDPLNNGVDFFGTRTLHILDISMLMFGTLVLDPIVAHLLACSLLALGTIPFV